MDFDPNNISTEQMRSALSKCGYKGPWDDASIRATFEPPKATLYGYNWRSWRQRLRALIRRAERRQRSIGG